MLHRAVLPPLAPITAYSARLALALFACALAMQACDSRPSATSDTTAAQSQTAPQSTPQTAPQTAPATNQTQTPQHPSASAAPAAPSTPATPPHTAPPTPPAAHSTSTNAAATPHELVDQTTLMAYLHSLPTKRAICSDPAHLQGLRDTQDLLVAQLTRLGYAPERWPFKITEQDFSLQRRNLPAAEADLSWDNIIVKIEGDDILAARARGEKDPVEEVILFGAHFDAVPGSPGADDDGSGAAALLEVARVLQGRRFPRSVRLVWFNAEEIGLIGSRRYAAAARDAIHAGRVKISAMLSVEMLGFYSDQPNSQKSPIPKIEGVFDPPTVADFIALAGTQRHAGLLGFIERAMLDGAPGIKVLAPKFIPDPPLTPPDILRSDHAPFMAIGIPSFLIGDTANFRSPHYHQPTDTIETLDPTRYTLSVRGLTNALEKLATEPKLPQPIAMESAPAK